MVSLYPKVVRVRVEMGSGVGTKSGPVQRTGPRTYSDRPKGQTSSPTSCTGKESDSSVKSGFILGGNGTSGEDKNV